MRFFYFSITFIILAQTSIVYAGIPVKRFTTAHYRYFKATLNTKQMAQIYDLDCLKSDLGTPYECQWDEPGVLQIGTEKYDVDCLRGTSEDGLCLNFISCRFQE